MKKIDMKEYVYHKIIETFETWDFEDVYSVSFFIYANDGYEYRNCTNVPVFAISSNKEAYFNAEYKRAIEYEKRNPRMFDEYTRVNQCDGGRYSETRWNYSNLEQDETWIFHMLDEEYEILFNWFDQCGIENIGYEDSNDIYDEKMSYIGKGPNGYRELFEVIKLVAKEIQESDYFMKKCSKRIPIIIQELNNVYYAIDATEEVNVHGEATDYLKYANA